MLDCLRCVCDHAWATQMYLECEDWPSEISELRDRSSHPLMSRLIEWVEALARFGNALYLSGGPPRKVG